jgi:predicted flap endonuclease-1-like 5' DNA nuclease
MVTLLWQTALLLLGAYFLGAFFGCMIRRLVTPAAKRTGRREVAVGAAAATATAGAVTAAGGTDRFAKALTGESLASQRAETERLERAAAASEDLDRIEPKIQQIAPSLSERDTAPVEPAPAPVPVAPPTVADEVQPDVTRDVAARNADAWTSSSATETTQDTSASSATTIAGAATATAAALGAAAFARSAPGPVQRPNDLRDIRAIDGALAERLNGLGVTRWQHVASWTPDDIARIDAELGLGGRIADENWIEQASILAAGGSTAYAARRALGEATVVGAPAVGGWAPRIQPEPQPEPEAPLAVSDDAQRDDGDTSGWTTAAIAAATAAAAAAATQRTEADEPPAEPEPAPASSEDTASPPQDRIPYDLNDYPRAAGTAGSSVVSADIAAAATASGESEQRWTWNADDVSAGRELTDAEPADGESTGDETSALSGMAGAAALAAAAAAAAATPEVPEETGPGDIVPEAPAEGETAPTPTPPLTPVASEDRDGEPLTGLRSVRSEALVGGQAMPLAADDLKRIRGLGVRDETQLRAMGVTTYDQVAEWSAEDVAEVDRALGLEGRIARENWIDQAKILSGVTTTAYAARRDAGLEGTGTMVAATPINPAALTSQPAAEPESQAPYAPPADKSDAPYETSDFLPDSEPAGASEPVISPGGFSDQISEIAPLDLSDEAEPTPNTDQSQDVAVGALATGAAAAVGLQSLSSPGDQPAEPPVPETSAQSSGADDLKRIRGVGVLLEKKLNAMGVTTYAQIANWTQDDIDRVSTGLSFQNRIEREKWIEQARILASGGQTEFSRRIDNNEF